MKLLTILKKLGKSTLKSVPAIGTVIEIVDFINEILPDNDSISDESTGDEIYNKLKNNLTNDQLNTILNNKFNLELGELQAHSEIIKALAGVDSMGKSTRPYIAKLIAINTIVIVDLIVAGFVCAVVLDRSDILEIMKNAWPFALGIIGPFIALLRSYFGMRTKEKTHKYEAVTNTPAPLSSIQSLIKLFKR